MLQFRQGDVLLVQRDDWPEQDNGQWDPVDRDEGRVVLAYGEQTGHAHALTEDGVELMEWVVPGAKPPALSDPIEAPMRMLVVPEGGATLTHEEHAPVMVPAGTYEVVRQSEYQPGAAPRFVAD